MADIYTSNKENEEKMMKRSVTELQKELKEVYEDIKYRGNSPYRRYVFVDGEGKEYWLKILEWYSQKYGKMLSNQNLTVGMLVSTLKKQTNKLNLEAEILNNQLSFFEDEKQKEVQRIYNEISMIEILKKICFQGREYFEPLYHAY